MSTVVAFTPDGVVEVSWSTPADGVAKARRRDGVWWLVVNGRESPLRIWSESDADHADLVAELEAKAGEHALEPPLPAHRHVVLTSGRVA